MNKTIASLTAAALLAFGAGAAQADGYEGGSARSFAPVITDNDWSGFYLNGSIGYGWGNSSVDIDDYETGDHLTGASADPEGFLGSVGLGYDWTFGRGLVFGVFTDYTFGNLDDTAGFAIFDPVENEIVTLPGKVEYDNMWAIGARAGYVIHNDLLLYGTVGYTSADFEFEGLKEDLDGYFVGVGLERRLHSNWYLKGEYRFSDFDDTSSSASGTSGGKCGGECDFDVDSEHEIHSIRVGLSYKFGARREEAVPLK